jgi:hypothetical protein
MNTCATGEPELSADFADRVLDAVDRRLVQRRRVRWGMGASAVCLAIAAAAGWNRFAMAPQPALPVVELAVAITPAPSAEVRAGSTDPLSYLFPDAEPLARFAAEDRGADADEGAGALFDTRD